MRLCRPRTAPTNACNRSPNSRLVCLGQLKDVQRNTIEQHSWGHVVGDERMLPYDVEKVLQTAEDCRRVMARALAKGDIGPDQAAFRRLCALTGAANDDPADPLVRAAWEAVAAYEQTLYQKHGRNQSAARTRQKNQGKRCVPGAA